MNVYLDTSSLIKLFVDEEGSDDVQALVAESTVITSIVAYAEARATFARLHRERALSAAALAEVKAAFESAWPTFGRIDVDDAIVHRAGDLAERYRLRGFDSIHLASYQFVSAVVAPDAVTFSSFDEALAKAARALRRIR